MSNQKDIAKKIRREALKKNWRLFRRSKLGMIGLYIVIFFLFLSILQPILFITGVWNKGTYDPVVGYSEQFQEFLVVECPKEYPTEKYKDRSDCPGRTEVNIRTLFYSDAQVGETIIQNLQPAPPSRKHILGTDSLGRDVFSQIMEGSQVAFVLGLLSATLGVTLSGTMPTCNVGPWPRIDGDGHGQEIVLTANTTGGAAAGSVGGVTVVNSGNSFTTAAMTVSSQPGASSPSGAIITPIIPPKGGHGYDPVTELGGYFIMINSKLTQDESGAFTTTNDFRKIGLLTDPNSDGAFTKYTAATGTQSKTFTFTSNTAAISGDITLSQNSVGANGATAYVVDVNASASTIRVIDVTNGANASAGYDGKPGSFQCTTSNSASSFTGVSSAVAAITYSGGSAVLTNVANGAMQIGSGKIIYIENRAPVARAADQTEDIKLIIEF